MSKRLYTIFLIYFTIIGILLIICLKILSNVFDSGYSPLQSKKVSYIQKTLRIPDEEDLHAIEIAYQDICTYFGSTDSLKEEIENLYNDVTSAKVCSIANRNFNSLEEKYNKYNQQLETIILKISSFEDKYNEYSNLLSNIPLYSVSLREEKYNEFSQKLEPLYNEIKNENENWTHDKEQIDSMYLESKQIADDLFNEYYDLMCHIVYAEAGICPRIERAYVANVIENRIAHYRFPNTIRGVIYSPGQYEPVMTGSINNTPSKSLRIDVEDYLRGRIETGMPSNVVYQARFIQGSGIWKHTPSGHYFCFW